MVVTMYTMYDDERSLPARSPSPTEEDAPRRRRKVRRARVLGTLLEVWVAGAVQARIAVACPYCHRVHLHQGHRHPILRDPSNDDPDNDDPDNDDPDNDGPGDDDPRSEGGVGATGESAHTWEAERIAVCRRGTYTIVG